MSNMLFDGPHVSLEEVLDARERRSHFQGILLEKYADAALLSATMNIPGPVKTSKPLSSAFEAFTDQIESLLAEKKVFSQLLQLKTGSEYYLVTDLPSEALKRLLVNLEEKEPLGRLMDLDVVQLIDGQPQPMSRSQLGLEPRKCYVCSAIAKECSRSRKHQVPELQEAISQLMTCETEI